MKKIILSCLFAMMLTPFNAIASNGWFMDNTPGGNFTSEDTDIFMQAINTALDKTPNGGKYTWRNPHTHASGYIVPMNTYSAHGTKCRELKIFNQAKGMTDVSRFHLCKMSGEWKVMN